MFLCAYLFQQTLKFWQICLSQLAFTFQRFLFPSSTTQQTSRMMIRRSLSITSPLTSSPELPSTSKHKKGSLTTDDGSLGALFFFKTLLLFHLHKYIANISINAYAPICNLAWTKRLAIIDTSIH